MVFSVGCILYLSGSEMSLKFEAIVPRCDQVDTCSLCSPGFAELGFGRNRYVNFPTRSKVAGACTETLLGESRTDVADTRFLLGQ